MLLWVMMEKASTVLASDLLLRLLKRAARNASTRSASGELERPKRLGSDGMRKDRAVQSMLGMATSLRGES
jgi:hypothetical protein